MLYVRGAIGHRPRWHGENRRPGTAQRGVPHLPSGAHGGLGVCALTPRNNAGVKAGRGCKSLNWSNVKPCVHSEFTMSSRFLRANVGTQCYEFAISLTNPLTHSTASARFWVTSKPSEDSAYRDAQFDPASIVGGHTCCPLYANSCSHVSRV